MGTVPIQFAALATMLTLGANIFMLNANYPSKSDTNAKANAV